MSDQNSMPTQKLGAGLSSLESVKLNSRHLQFVESAKTSGGGPAAFRHRVAAEIREVCALAQVSGRLRLHHIDVGPDLRMVLDLDVPVPCMRTPAEGLQVHRGARLGIMYSPEAMLTPQPGYAFVRILGPGPVHHPNCSPTRDQALCLGASLPAGISLKEIILMTYGALTMQSIQLDASDPAGVMNLNAAEWWQANAHRIPLTREPFIKEESRHDC